MNARRRYKKYEGLPDNLYANGKYFQYKNPITGKKVSINRPLADAVRLAKAANAKLLPLVADPNLLESITGEPAARVSSLLDRYSKEYLPDQKLADSTRNEIRIKLERYRKDLGQRLIGQLDVLAMAEYLDQFENNAYTKHRALWVQIFRFAVSKGLTDKNAAEMTLRKKETDKVRRRHTVEGVTAMLSANTTPDWLKLAIKLALLTLQRREDLVTWKRTAVDLDANTMRVTASKTENYDAPIHLEIEMGPDLRAVVVECLQYPITGPHLLRYRPGRITKAIRDSKEHWSAITPDHLTKCFRKARDDAKAYDHISDPAARPTLHELRALGAWLYEQQGYSVEYVQALMGHATEGMTRYYQSGHGEHRIEYMRVSAGLSLK